MQGKILLGLITSFLVSCNSQEAADQRTEYSTVFSRVMFTNITEISDSLLKKSQDESTNILLPSVLACSESGTATVGFNDVNKTLSDIFYIFKDCRSKVTNANAYDLTLSGEMAVSITNEAVRHYVGELKFDGSFKKTDGSINKTCNFEWWIGEKGFFGQICGEKYQRDLASSVKGDSVLNDRPAFYLATKLQTGYCHLGNDFCETRKVSEFSAILYNVLDGSFFSKSIVDLAAGKVVNSSKIVYDMLDFAYDKEGKRLFIARGEKGIWILKGGDFDFQKIAPKTGIIPQIVSSIAWNSKTSELVVYEIIDGLNRTLKYDGTEYSKLETADFDGYEEDISFDSTTEQYFTIASEGAEKTLSEVKRFDSAGNLLGSLTLSPQLSLGEGDFMGKVQVKASAGKVYLAVSNKTEQSYYLVSLDDGTLTKIGE